MSPEKQRIAIAEACGWTFHPPCYNKPPFTYQFKCEALLCWLRPGNGVWKTESPPDYLNDLNAMHEAEKMLTNDQWIIYLRFLSGELDIETSRWPTCFLNLESVREIASATATQRAEAFLRTLGKWEESK